MTGMSDVRAVRENQILSVMAAARISPIISLHCEMMGSAESAYPATQVVESHWREFDGLAGEVAIRDAARPRVAALLASSERLVTPWAEAVRAALQTVTKLMDMSVEVSPTQTMVIEAALAVAHEFDRYGPNPPADAASWVDFEAACHSSATSRVRSSVFPFSRGDLFDMSLSAGIDGMQYHRALKEWSQGNG
ncbi:hypothetical protein ACFC0S_07975 [Streptomyces sp. NPDC056084]|uniref:hypothetical protein n=1 Tax=unclassified Streptomyces TaxID=2593676 RepID=UPI0035E19390